MTELIFDGIWYYVITWTIICMIFSVGFLMIGGTAVTVKYLNHSLALKKMKIYIVGFLFGLGLICWFILFLSFFDAIQWNYVFDYDSSAGRSVFNNVILSSKYDGSQFFVVLFSIVGAKGALRLLEVLPILLKKELEFSKHGILRRLY